MILVTGRDFSIDEAILGLQRRETGAVVMFLGVVRGTSGRRKVTKLEFEADRVAATIRLKELRHEAIRRFGIQDATIIHRIGTLGVSEKIVLIAVAGSHRRESFAACRYIIEELKRSVPIWKKEYMGRGWARWVPAIGGPVRGVHIR